MNTLPIELTAAAFGVAGTILLALNGPHAGWGFVAYRELWKAINGPGSWDKNPMVLVYKFGKENP